MNHEDDALDALLAASPNPIASPALIQRIVAAAPAPRARARQWVWLTGFGASLAAACAAGVVVGGAFAPSFTTLTQTPRETHADLADETVADLNDAWDAG